MTLRQHDTREALTVLSCLPESWIDAPFRTPHLVLQAALGERVTLTALGGGSVQTFLAEHPTHYSLYMVETTDWDSPRPRPGLVRRLARLGHLGHHDMNAGGPRARAVARAIEHRYEHPAVLPLAASLVVPGYPRRRSAQETTAQDRAVCALVAHWRRRHATGNLTDPVVAMAMARLVSPSLEPYMRETLTTF